MAQEDIVVISERIASLETNHDIMKEDIGEIKSDIKELTRLANQGKGSLATILWVGGFIAAAIGVVSSLIGFSFGHK